MYYIGYKYAGDINEQNRISSNNDLIQTQNHAHYEWFMNYNSVSDEAKENRDLYATLKKIREMNPFVPGVYTDIRNITEEEQVDAHLRVRIPVSAFLTLYNLKFFPNWAGKLSIEIYPSYKNLVIAPVLEFDVLYDEPFRVVVSAGSYAGVELGFKNINQPMRNHIVKNEGRWEVVEQTFKCDGTDCKADKCKIR